MEQMLVMGGTLGASAMMLAQNVVEQGGTPTIVVQGALLSAGVAMFVFFDRRERAAQNQRNLERREADLAKDKEIGELRAQVRALYDQLLREREDRG